MNHEMMGGKMDMGQMHAMMGDCMKMRKDGKMCEGQMMDRQGNTYLYCQFGNGPHREFYLPRDIRGLADDPYRSLAWFVRKSGGFKNSEKNFAEFQWANFFRKKKLLNRYGMAGFPKALQKAIELAQSPEAKKLPGYGKLHLEAQEKAKIKAVKKVKKYKKRFKEREIVVSS